MAQYTLVRENIQLRRIFILTHNFWIVNILFPKQTLRPTLPIAMYHMHICTYEHMHIYAYDTVIVSKDIELVNDLGAFYYFFLLEVNSQSKFHSGI